MILTGDIGNTGMVFGFYDEDKLKELFRMSSVPARLADEYELSIRQMCAWKDVVPKRVLGRL